MTDLYTFIEKNDIIAKKEGVKMQIDLTEKMIVTLHEELSDKIKRDLVKKYNEEEKVIEVMMEYSRRDGYDILETRELINEFMDLKNKKSLNKKVGKIDNNLRKIGEI